MAAYRVALVRRSVRTYVPKIVSDLILVQSSLYTHVCDHNILIKFDSHGNRFSHLGVTALYLPKILQKYIVWAKLLHCYEHLPQTFTDVYPICAVYHE